MKASDVKPGQTFTCENETRVYQRVWLPGPWWTYAGEQDFVPVVQSDTGRLDGMVKSVTVQLVNLPTMRLDTLEPGDRFTLETDSDTVYTVLEDGLGYNLEGDLPVLTGTLLTGFTGDTEVIKITE